MLKVLLFQLLIWSDYLIHYFLLVWCQSLFLSLWRSLYSFNGFCRYDHFWLYKLCKLLVWTNMVNLFWLFTNYYNKRCCRRYYEDFVLICWFVDSIVDSADVAKYLRVSLAWYHFSHDAIITTIFHKNCQVQLLQSQSFMDFMCL